MCEKGGQEESLLWENKLWDLLSNSDNSGGSEGKLSGTKKMVDSSNTSNSQTPTTEQEAAAVAGRKRSGGDVEGNNNNNSKGGTANESDHEIHIWTERERRKKMRNMFSNLHALLPQLPPKADKSTIVDEAVSYIKTLQQTLQKLQKQKLEKLQGVTAAVNHHHDASSSRITIKPTKLGTMEMRTTREAFLADQGSSSNHNNYSQGNNFNASSSSISAIIPRYPVLFQTWTSPNVTLNVCGEDAHISVCSSKKPGLLTAICYVLEKHKLELVSAHVSSDHTRSMYMIQAHAAARGSVDQFPEAYSVEEIYKQAAGDISFWVTSYSS